MENIYILLQVALVTALLVLIPGYFLFLALFPRDSRYDPIQIIGISGILGLSINILFGTIQTQIPGGVGLKLSVHLPVLALFSCACGIVYLLRNRPISFDKQKIHIAFQGWMDYVSAHFIPALVIIGFFVIGTMAFVSLYPQLPENSFTEFYVLDASDTIPYQPLPGSDGELRLRIGVINRENEPVDYRIQLESHGKRLTDPVQLSLQHGEEWQVNLSLNSSRLKGIPQLDILLYKSGAAEPYRRLRLDLKATPNVPSPPSTTKQIQTPSIQQMAGEAHQPAP